MGDDIVQLTRDAGSLAPGHVVEQVSGDCLPGGVLMDGLAALAPGDARQRGRGREGRQEQQEHPRLGSNPNRSSQREQEECEWSTRRRPPPPSAGGPKP